MCHDGFVRHLSSEYKILLIMHLTPLCSRFLPCRRIGSILAEICLIQPLQGFRGCDPYLTVIWRSVMNRIKSFLVYSLLAALGIVFSACGGAVLHTHKTTPAVCGKHAGPPPHAPAHGYRHRHSDGVELVYRSSIGVYVAVGYSEHYFHKDRYYRLVDGSWQVSFRIDKGWTPVPEKKLPPGLRKKHKVKHKDYSKK